MADPRIAKLAHVLVRYSLALEEGDLFTMRTGPLAAPLVRELYREALQVGAHPMPRIAIDGLEALLYRYGSDAQIGYISPMMRLEIEEIDQDFRGHSSIGPLACGSKVLRIHRCSVVELARGPILQPSSRRSERTALPLCRREQSLRV